MSSATSGHHNYGFPFNKLPKTTSQPPSDPPQSGSTHWLEEEKCGSRAIHFEPVINCIRILITDPAAVSQTQKSVFPHVKEIWSR